jgi:hypothetical protein
MQNVRATSNRQLAFRYLNINTGREGESSSGLSLRVDDNVPGNETRLREVRCAAEY